MPFLDILLLFIVGNVLGFVIETVYCYFFTGKIESRRGVVYGPFNQVYGFGVVLMTLLLPPLVGGNLPALFIGSALLGGLFEALCSFFQESAYGTVSWEYSGQRFSLLGGRTSLTYMFYWGILGTFYIRVIHPLLFRLFQRIPLSIKAPVVLALTLFLIFDFWLSNAAVRRWRSRLDGIPAAGKLEVWLDKKFTNERMLKIYPSMKVPVRDEAGCSEPQ